MMVLQAAATWNIARPKNIGDKVQIPFNKDDYPDNFFNDSLRIAPVNAQDFILEFSSEGGNISKNCIVMNFRLVSLPVDQKFPYSRFDSESIFIISNL